MLLRKIVKVTRSDYIFFSFLKENWTFKAAIKVIIGSDLGSNVF